VEGEAKLNKTAKEQMETVVKALDDYEKSIGLPEPITPGTEEELQQYFSMNRDELESLSARDCAAISLRLAQFSLYIQRLYNRETSRLNWAKTTLSESIAKEFGNYSQYTKYDIKVALIAKENEFVRKVQQIINYAQQRMDRLYFLSTNIKYLSEVMQANQRAKMIGKHNG
jgi:hypothetical protein